MGWSWPMVWGKGYYCLGCCWLLWKHLLHCFPHSGWRRWGHPNKGVWGYEWEFNSCFTWEEVATALKQIHPTKAPGPDSMSAIFYQKYWGIVGNSVTKMVLNVLNNNLPMNKINKTNISLIPKTSSPKKMTNFRPISLCNVIYKFISKTLANRLKNLLPLIIFENQSAFTPNRLITNNVLVAFELMHYLNHKLVG